jgi:hypothetical protein
MTQFKGPHLHLDVLSKTTKNLHDKVIKIQALIHQKTNFTCTKNNLSEQHYKIYILKNEIPIKTVTTKYK